MEPKYLLWGEILRPHGVMGDLKVRLLTDYPERILELDQIFVGRDIDASDIKTYEVEDLRLHQGFGLVKLAGVDDREAAERLRKQMLMIAFKDAVPLEENEVYLFQLIGMTIVLEDGSELGAITDVLETGANDVYIVQSERYGEVLIPVTHETILETDIPQRRITVKLPEGLLP